MVTMSAYVGPERRQRWHAAYRARLDAYEMAWNAQRTWVMARGIREQMQDERATTVLPRQRHDHAPGET
jgi:hypothetical protein